MQARLRKTLRVVCNSGISIYGTQFVSLPLSLGPLQHTPGENEELDVPISFAWFCSGSLIIEGNQFDECDSFPPALSVCLVPDINLS